MKQKVEEQAHVPAFAFQLAKKCGAKTRRGTLCQGPATEKGRCRFHGGAKGSGAPKGNQNALKHGLYSHSLKNHLYESKKLLKFSLCSKGEI